MSSQVFLLIAPNYGMDFKVFLHKAEEGGYYVTVPSLPGCFSQGENREEALRNIEEAIALYLETMAEDNEPLFEVRKIEERRVGKECRSRWSPYH